jgi:hypothetical protein
MHPDVHLVRTRPPILDVPPLVWIEPPGAPRACTPSTAPLWEWPEATRSRNWRLALRLTVALVVTLGLVAADAPAPPPAPILLPVPDEPIWCACIWWPSGPARSLTG